MQSKQINGILITGCAGLIGSHLAQRFLELGYTVVGVDNLVGGYKNNIPTHDNFYFHEADILNHYVMNGILNYYEPDVVIHCAALAHEGLSVFSPKVITENIFVGTVCVASAAIANNVKLFINTSSMARYGNAAAPFKESTVPQPADPYGLAKLQAEQQLNLLSKIHGIKVVHMVPHNVCGPHQCYSDPFRNVLSIFANRMLHEKPVYVYGDGNQQRSFSHVNDCVDAYIAIVNNMEHIESGEVFNIGPDHGSEITINNLVSLVAKYFNTQANVINLPERPCEVRDAWVETDKARTILNYETKFSTEDVVKDTVVWIKNSVKLPFNYHLDLEIINDKTPKTWTEKLFNK